MSNREIKFRAQRLGTKEWVYGDLIRHSKIDPFTYIAIGTGYKIDDPELGMPIKVYPHTVGQFTGLKDKDGKEIYEGDIVKGRSEYINGEKVEGEILFANASFIIKNEKEKSMLLYFCRKDEFEVIGNIYENPELLGGTNHQ